MVMGKKAYTCEICGFHYREKKDTDACRDYCRKHGACSMDITKKSIELSESKI